MKRTYLGIAYFVFISIILPYIVLNLISSAPNLKGFMLLSLFMSIFGGAFGIMVDMILVKGSSFQKNLEISQALLKSTIIKKKIYDDSFEAPFFLFVMNPAFWIMAKACEKNDKYYSFEVQVDGVKGIKQVFVTKQQFSEYEEDDEIILSSKEMERHISVCWFEKLVIGEFKDTVIEKYTKYELKYIYN